MKNFYFYNRRVFSLFLFIIFSTVIVFSDVEICLGKKNTSSRVYVDSNDFAPIEMKERVFKKTGKEWSEFSDEEKQVFMEQWDEYQQSKKEKALKTKKIAEKKERNKAKYKKKQDRQELNKIKAKQHAAKIKAKAKKRKKKDFNKTIKNQKKKMKHIRKRNANKQK
ncbi:MAG: hypothetical protein A2Y03_04190 [Omnitrophica WOR_2 bacterium GWF2_38_59]|nr:MAG: hypothetical protein A2Y03_04190 [Omnitrophica WOR_2 bacterium GWF2_38_59]OGX50196.1 MAG: hypothetical protein A2243_08670 [Omnitrophica WOR_2 bacterium RIFOXYA2_FULL_38_17]OGX52822.1 MAG: hypothetical protein A2267_07695 [Omnitrophica WOR_2 bacterium RIFOXYA12_FULL_38_10]OGX57436.1 MAG: hypothetical protein A2306_02910 [Omnitrophica WOR_2 bacterium RIFOXYB2_FULL_38_16]OGX57508.1 MAG: hypothetical protein A2447_03490 [Omnitrophica WOR_2 bacterium RIFOXYC2_FULL_38_12]HBG60457.1 hypothet